MTQQIGLFDFIMITDENHKHFGRRGKITNYDTVDKEYIVYFDKITNDGNVYWGIESARVELEQVKRISKFDLEKILLV